MKVLRKGAIVLGALTVLSAIPAAGQNVEAIMRARETLELTDDQINRLDAIRREIVSQRSAEMAEMAELRSRLAAGQIRRSEVMAAQEDRQAAAEGRAQERRARIDAVLTEEQRASVEQIRTRGDRVRDRRQGLADTHPASPIRAPPGLVRAGLVVSRQGVFARSHFRRSPTS